MRDRTAGGGDTDFQIEMINHRRLRVRVPGKSPIRADRGRITDGQKAETTQPQGSAEHPVLPQQDRNVLGLNRSYTPANGYMIDIHAIAGINREFKADPGCRISNGHSIIGQITLDRQRG